MPKSCILAKSWLADALTMNFRGKKIYYSYTTIGNDNTQLI